MPARINLAPAIGRILLGLLFAVVGLNGFLMFMPPPATGIPPVAAAFSGAMFTSHYMYFTSGVQVLAGVLLLVNRYVLFALLLLAAVLANIVAFHITMWPQTLFPMPVLALILWFVAAWPLRSQFFRLLTPIVQE